MKTEISAGDKNKETGDNSSDTFEIIKCKRKSADNKQETRQDDKKKKPKSTNDNVPKSAQKTNPKNNNDALNKSQISRLTNPFTICYDNCQNFRCFYLDGINFMRVEACEILAFIITDSERICKPGIPPHLPIAYGLQGHSLPMKIMLRMLNDIQNELKKVDVKVLCEICKWKAFNKTTAHVKLFQRSNDNL